MRSCILLFLSIVIMTAGRAQLATQADSNTFNMHEVQLDAQNKILSWIQPQSRAYDEFIRQRWNFVKTKAPMSPGPAPRSNYPQYYFYCAYRVKNGQLELDTWMNDIGERLPNWTESARLYYAYTGDTMVMQIVKGLLDYSLTHGTTPASFAWPNFPYTTTNAGDTIFTGFTSAKRFAMHEVQVDHAGDIGLAYYRMYQYTGDDKYKIAAVNVANTLASHVRTGSATQSPWSYRVIMDSGTVTSEYGANWFGCYTLLDELQQAGFGKPSQYKSAMKKVRDFILKYPMKTGYWTDGHTDTDIKSHTYKSNMSASNAKLYLFDHPEFDPAWKRDIPKLIKWTEDNFITRSAPGEPSNLWGANIVGEQDEFLFKMDYQTARYGAECARWFAISGDSSFRDKAFRSLNWVTYCSDSTGLAFESPLSKNISSWWSDCYGECPRMFYHAMAAVPEWAPENEDHILYATGLLKDVAYENNSIRYIATDGSGKEYIKTTFKPSLVTINGKKAAYSVRNVQGGGYEVIIKRSGNGQVVIAGN